LGDLIKTMKRRRTPEDRYNLNVRRQQKTLEKFAAHELEWANDLILWYKAKKLDMPEDEYRACAFFINKEYRNKAGALTLLYEVNLRCLNEMPKVTRENAFDLLRYQYKIYAKALARGGF
jgi:hypothetical protein